MNKTDKSLEKINYVKLLIFLVIFIFITLLLISILILPNIKKYRVARSEFHQAKIHKIRVQSILKEREKELKKLRLDNHKIFTAFKHNFSKKEFLTFAKRFFDKVSLKDANQSSYTKEYDLYELNVTSLLKTPVKFYQFLDGLNHYSNMVQADFPIDLKSNGKMIYSSFKIKVYSLHKKKK